MHCQRVGSRLMRARLPRSNARSPRASHGASPPAITAAERQPRRFGARSPHSSVNAGWKVAVRLALESIPEPQSRIRRGRTGGISLSRSVPPPRPLRKWLPARTVAYLAGDEVAPRPRAGHMVSTSHAGIAGGRRARRASCASRRPPPVRFVTPPQSRIRHAQSASAGREGRHPVSGGDAGSAAASADRAHAGGAK